MSGFNPSPATGGHTIDDSVIHQSLEIEQVETGKSVSNVPETDAIGAQLMNQFQTWKDAKLTIENEMVEDLRAFSSKYSEEQIRGMGDLRSKVYFGITRTKAMAAYSRLVDLLMQGGDPAWSVAPTPEPELNQELTRAIRLKAMQDIINHANGVDLIPEDFREYVQEREAELEVIVKEAVEEHAKETAEKMTVVIKDQLIEGAFDQLFKTALLEMCIVGHGCLKGVTLKIDKRKRWKQNQKWSAEAFEQIAPKISAPSVFNLYPDPYCTDKDDMIGIYERHILTKGQFIKMAETGSGFRMKVVWEIVTLTRSGNHTEEAHEIERRQMAGLSPSGESNRFEVLEYWGAMDGQDLEQCGCKVPDTKRVYQANIWMCASRVIKAQLNPYDADEIPYHLFPYERVPHQFWGTSIARMMRDSQETINTAIRVFLDNTAISSGPQVEVNMDMLHATEDATQIYPWKIWKRSGSDATHPMLRFYQPANHSSSLEKIIEMFRRFIDEETSLPSYTHGSQGEGLNKTASGMSMLMGAANVAIKSVVKNIDDFCIRPLISSLYDWNMQWNDDEAIKGDLKVDARGSTVLIAKEIQSNRMIQFAQLTAGDPTVDRVYLNREIAKSLEIDSEKAVPDAPSSEELIAAGGGGGIDPAQAQLAAPQNAQQVPTSATFS